MKTETINEKPYRLPGSLTKFQKDMYVHLINWKWEKMKIKEPGVYRYRGEDILYDAILPDSAKSKFPIIYPEVLDDLLAHQTSLPFKLHLHFNHMASSQAANVNLFLPVLLSPKANEILRQLKPDLKSLETAKLYKGFQIEFWDGKGDERGLLGDHNARSGTDSDIAIAYKNQDGKLCLWLIEHKLTEKEFTTCGAFKSKGRNAERHDCDHSFAELISNKSWCYYHDVRKNNYWTITEKHQEFFSNNHNFDQCPFRNGMNQLWRNQLLALGLEDIGDYKHVYFSVVRHPDNPSLERTILEYQELTNYNPKFSAFTSKDVVDIVKQQNNDKLSKWAAWYDELYRLKEESSK